MATLIFTPGLSYANTPLSNITRIKFDGSGNGAVQFSASQFDNVQIYQTVVIEGAVSFESVNVINAASFDASSWAFVNWPSSNRAPPEHVINITGTANGDTITGSSDRDVIDGGAGDDILRGGQGVDLLQGGASNDTFVVDDENELQAFDGVDGGAGTADRVVQKFGGSLDFTGVQFSGVEKFEFDGNDAQTSQLMRFLGPYAATTPGLNFSGDEGFDGVLVINPGVTDLSSPTFINWEPTGSNPAIFGDEVFGDYVEILGSGGIDIITGSSVTDIIRSTGGADIIATGEGNDQVSINHVHFVPGLKLDMGAGNDDVLTLFDAGIYSFDENISGFEVLFTTVGTFDVNLLGSHTGPGKLQGIGAGSATVNLTVTGSSDLSGLNILSNNPQPIKLYGTNAADIIIGSAYNDISYFDQADINVLGGSGFDIGRYTDATQGLRSFDLAGKSIEQLTWVTNGNLYTLTAGAGGTRSEYVADAAGTEASFAQRTTVLDFLLREELVDILTYAATRLVYDYDASNAADWRLILQVYDNTTLLDYTDTRYDNNARVVRDEDQATAFDWSSITTTYTGAGAVDYQDSQYDAGARVIFDGDQDNAFNWQSVSTTYVAVGAVDYQDTIYDDGRRVIFDSDQAAAFVWSTRSTSYASGGVLDVQDTRLDDNSRVIFDWDNGDQSSYWDTWENFYNPAGTLYAQRLMLDDGSVITINL